jgi:hypothetical protein
MNRQPTGVTIRPECKNTSQSPQSAASKLARNQHNVLSDISDDDENDETHRDLSQELAQTAQMAKKTFLELPLQEALDQLKNKICQSR